MSDHARPLVSPQAAPVDRRTWTAIEIVRPAIVLLRARPSLDILLVKDAEESYEVTRLHGVRLATIPLARRLAWLRFRAKLGVAHLPDEFLYCEVRLRRVRDVHRASAVFDRLLFPLGESADPFPIELLSRNEFQLLQHCRGRVLVERVREIFSHVAAVREPPSEPSWLDVVGEILTVDLRSLLRRARKGMAR